TDFAIEITNTGTAHLEAVNIVVPAEFSLVSLTAPLGWTVNGTEILATGPGLAPGDTFTVVVTAVTAIQDGDTSYDFAVTADAFDYVGEPLTVLVTGTATVCEGACTLS